MVGHGALTRRRRSGPASGGTLGRDETSRVGELIAGYVEGVARELSASARREERLSSGSLVFSYVGGGLVILGFSLQIVGLFY